MSYGPDWDFSSPSRVPEAADHVTRGAPAGLWDQRSEGRGSNGLFDDSAGTGVPITSPAVTRPPLGVLIAGCGAAGVGLLLAWGAADRPVLALVAWLLGGFSATGLLGLFSLQDGRRRADPWYAASSAVPVLRVVLLAVAVSAVAASAWRFADVVSRWPR